MRKKQWQSNPPNAGHRRDFNRVDDPHVSDPLFIEKLLAEIESQVAPILKALFGGQRGPDERELSFLVEFMALQWVRLPSFRSTIDRTVESMVAKGLSSKEEWENLVRSRGLPVEAPGLEYSRVLEASQRGDKFYSGEPGFYMLYAAKFVEDVAEAFRSKYWNVIIYPNGGFIGSDNPVGLDGPKGVTHVGNADTVAYPVNRFVLLYGRSNPIIPPPASRQFVARCNTFAMLMAEEQIYSHVPDFEWLDDTENYRTDWELFDKEKFRK